MSSRSKRTLYVGNLPGDIREREVEDLFYKYGPIAHIELKIPPRPPGYAFVEFEEARDALDAIDGRDGYDFDGHRLRVELAHGGRGHSASTDRHSSFSGGRRGVSKHTEYRVLITGLPNSASWQDLKDHMRKAGDVCFSQVFREGGGTTGIVDYTNYEDMKNAVYSLPLSSPLPFSFICTPIVVDDTIIGTMNLVLQIRKLDDTEFRNAFSRAYVRVKEYKGSPSPSRGRSRSRSRSRGRGRSYSRSRSPSRSPKKASRRLPARSRSRSVSSRSRSRSPVSRSPSKSRSPVPSRKKNVSKSPKKRSPSPRRSRSRSLSKSKSPVRERRERSRSLSKSKSKSKSPSPVRARSRSRSLSQ